MWKFIQSLGIALAVMLVAVSFNSVIGAGIAALLGLPLWTGAVAINVLALAVGPFVTSRSVARAGVNQEVWTGVVLKKLREALENLGWFAAITNYAQYVDNDTLHFTELGGDPKVLSHPSRVRELKQRRCGNHQGGLPVAPLPGA